MLHVIASEGAEQPQNVAKQFVRFERQRRRRLKNEYLEFLCTLRVAISFYFHFLSLRIFSVIFSWSVSLQFVQTFVEMVHAMQWHVSDIFAINGFALCLTERH